MPTCPNCGHDLPRENTRIGGEVVDELLKAIGGPKQLARDIAAHHKKVKKNPNKAGSLYRLELEMIQAEDKARMYQNHVEEVGESQERSFVMEYVLADRELLEEINAVARVRGMLPAPMDVEFERVA